MASYQVEINKRGIFWQSNGQFHRKFGPSIIYSDGHQAWYLNGIRHREDGPAVIYSNGRGEWYLNGIRQDGPAITWVNGRKEWWVNGVQKTPSTAMHIVKTDKSGRRNEQTPPRSS